MLIDLELPDEVEQSGTEEKVNMCKALEEMRQDAIEEGKAETKQQIIQNMLGQSLSPEEIADLTGIPLEEVEKIAAN